MIKPAITNALLRCRRADDLAEGVFELVRKDLGLWVLELPEDFQELFNILNSHRTLLKSLALVGVDYTLFLEVGSGPLERLRIPANLADLSEACGFAIEVRSEVM
ncbi:hypothetical protein N9891_00540 [bacterium]|nr:hypothetical protein [bacterium]